MAARFKCNSRNAPGCPLLMSPDQERTISNPPQWPGRLPTLKSDVQLESRVPRNLPFNGHPAFGLKGPHAGLAQACLKPTFGR